MPDQPDDFQDLSGSQTSRTTPPPVPPSLRTPTPASGHVQQPSAQRYDRSRKRKRDRNRSALYLPAWSVGLMLLLVFGIVGAIVLLVITLGGQSAPGGQPQIVIITANPSATPALAAVTAASTQQPLPNLQGPLPTFDLSGPTLPPVILSPTPMEINIGVTVTVNVDGLNIRQSPGLNQKVVTNANQGDQFKVIEGPQSADSLTWWHIQDPTDSTRDGWAAADYLTVEATTTTNIQPTQAFATIPAPQTTQETP